MQKVADDTINDTLFGLLGCVSDKTLTPVNLNNALSTFESIQPLGSKQYSEKSERRFTEHAILVANFMCQISTNSASTNMKKKETWQALQIYAEELQKEPTESNTLALSFVFGALALFNESDNGAKAAASAISSTISRNKVFRHAGRSVANIILKTFLVHASGSNVMNLNIITHFARAFKITHEDDPQYSDLAADAISCSLGLANNRNARATINLMPVKDDEDVTKQKVSAALAFACQIGPWNNLSPVLLVESAIPHDLWHAAELVCSGASKVAASKSKLPDIDTILYDKAAASTEATCAVETLVDAAMEARLYRLADNIATRLYNEGGMSRYVEARLYHAYETISKVVHKRQLPIIERQVDRVDRSVAKLKEEKINMSQQNIQEKEFSFLLSASQEIREFVLEKLSEAGEIEAAKRLAALWEMEYACDEAFMSQAAAARKRRYLQWDEVLTGNIPELISEPHTLLRAFESIKNDDLFGIDAEWDEETVGVSLFQLASRKEILLIDIPALSSTEEGVKALSLTVGALLDSDSIVVGFTPRHDLSRLRASPCASVSHWMNGARAVVDAQELAGNFDSDLKTRGLSRVCQYYLGKPLDKAEQCSMWSARPLSNHQRIYASLDAWVCVAIYEKLFPHGNPHKSNKKFKVMS